MPIEYYDKIAFEDDRFPVKTCFAVRVKEGEVGALSRLAWHEELELKLYKKGGAKLQIGNEVVTAEDGDVVIVNPCEPHCTISVTGECEYDIVIMNVNFLREKTCGAENAAKLVNYAEGRLKLSRLIRNNPRVKKAAEALFSEIASGRKRENDMAIRGVLLWLFAVLFEEEVSDLLDRSAIVCAEQLKKIQPAIEYANANYSRAVSLASLADCCKLSPTYFSKLFKEVLRVNPKDYLNQLRLNAAESLLLTTDEKISAIAQECGMDDVCYFNRWFKRNKGITPGEYRKQ